MKSISNHRTTVKNDTTKNKYSSIYISLDAYGATVHKGWVLQMIRPQVWQYRLLANGAVARALREGRVDMLGACLVILGRDKGQRRGVMGNGKRGRRVRCSTQRCIRSDRSFEPRVEYNKLLFLPKNLYHTFRVSFRVLAIT